MSTESKNQRVEYVLFDMDGLLIDSERVYSEVTNSILARYGREMTWEIKAQLMGKPERVGAELMWSLLPGIENDLSIDDYLSERRRLQDLQWPLTKLLPGVYKLVKHLHAHNIPMAVATGSIRRNFELKTIDPRCDEDKLEIFKLFGDKVVCGDDSQTGRGPWTNERTVRGKPAPDIFLSAAEMIGRPVGREEGGLGEVTEQQKVERSRGLVFEDGIPGVQAALRAGMQVVWVPDPNLLAVEPSLDVARIPSIEQFRPEDYGLPPYDP
ncbi:hypothetical protein FRC14_000743 [Serendipita sp. 396]|nr:hypothetical protein FRC14_000743 [Serendipita sp. 396]KAG8801396.1 hypothetical protein FRC16_000595 [Serendipita sp. 398]KAG8821902.1 hypothetical protein FRC19_007039 [Serendipita sp. 401]KAG9054119.1 hypothetical protein FS842_006137 [Serendipita sp. 407]